MQGNCCRNVNGSSGCSLFSFIALSKTTPTPPGRWARWPGATAIQAGREDRMLLQGGCLTWVPSKAKPEVRLWVQVVYLGGDRQNESGRRERVEEGREGMGRRGGEQKTLGPPAPQSPPPARGLSEASSWRLAWAQPGLLAQQACSEPPSHILPSLTPLPLA